VVHDEPARGAVSFLHPSLLGRRRVSQQYVTFAAGTLLQDVTAAGDDCLHGQVRLLGESVGQNAQDSAILCGRCGQNNEFIRIEGLRRDWRGKTDKSSQGGTGKRTSKSNHSAVSCGQSPTGLD